MIRFYLFFRPMCPGKNRFIIAGFALPHRF